MNKPSKDGGTATNNNNDKNKAEVNGLRASPVEKCIPRKRHGHLLNNTLHGGRNGEKKHYVDDDDDVGRKKKILCVMSVFSVIGWI